MVKAIVFLFYKLNKKVPLDTDTCILEEKK